MEVFLSFFRIISTFLAQTLYETSIINHLFSFDLEKKVVLIKDKKKKKKELDGISNDSPKIFPSNNHLQQKSIFYLSEQRKANSKNKLNDNAILVSPNKKKKKENKR